MGSLMGLPAGIRQVCPLSPLLFAIVVDGLLRRSRADDAAVVLEDIVKELPVLERMLQEIGGRPPPPQHPQVYLDPAVRHGRKRSPVVAQAFAGMTIAGCGKYPRYGAPLLAAGLQESRRASESLELG